MTAGISRHWWWRPGWQPGSRLYTFHFTFARQPAVQELAAGARARLAGFSWLDPVPGRWLHCTTQWFPHVSVAYANADGPAAPVDAALAGLPAATVTLAALDLIRLGRDRHVYEWEAIASIPLGG